MELPTLCEIGRFYQRPCFVIPRWCWLLGTGVRFECTKCGACCSQKDILITLTAKDIARMSSSLGLSVDETLRALDFYVVSPGQEIPVGLKEIPTINTERGPAWVALKKMDGKECVFLKDNLCMIHEIRPSVCVSFPFIFKEGDGEFEWGLSAKKEICPGIGTGPEIEPSELEATAGSVLDDLRDFRKFVNEWNSRSEDATARSFVEAVLSNPRFAL
ncbi:MAG: YkgJ family cysteine cluster protein [Candidatus Thorarchaeota archaeon]|nr:MAG: YkgJ family cysteine cluster protein [Candidatus Thorarchaeota archaeon]